MSIRVLRVCLILLPVSVFGQPVGGQTVTPLKSPSVTRPDLSVQQGRDIAELHKKMKELNDTLEALQTYIFTTQDERLSALEHRSAVFGPASPGPYSRIDTEVGPLLISLGKVEQYLDGYSVQIEIGNLSAASLIGFKLSASWAKRFKKDERIISPG